MRAAIYVRQSLDRSGEGLAVSRQLTDCRALVKARGWRTVATFTDNDTSATSGKRPEYERLLEAVRQGRVDVIVSWAPDRLARRPRDLEDLIDLVEDRGVVLATVSGDVDLSTAYGKAVTRIFGAIARQETEQKGARQRRANLERATSGEARWSRRPFGYTRAADGSAVLVADEADELRSAADRVLAGESLAAVVRDLNDREVPTSLGNVGGWTVSSLRRLLLNPRMAGRVDYNGQVVADGAWPPILDADTFDMLGARLRDPARRRQTSTTRKYLLSGYVKCGRCGERMFASPMKVYERRWMAYRCGTHLSRRMDLVDEVVEAYVVARLADPRIVASLAPRASRDDRALRRQAEAIRGRLDDLARLLAEGVLTPAGVRSASEKLKAELADVESQRAALLGDDDLAEVVGQSSVTVEDAWAAASLNTRRRIVERLVEVTILPVGKGARFDPDQVLVEWKVAG